MGRGWSLGFSPALKPWVLAPSAVALALTGGGACLAHHYAAAFIAQHTAGHGAVVGALMWLVMWMLVLGAAYVSYVAACLTATAPFVGVLSERAEELAEVEATERGERRERKRGSAEPEARPPPPSARRPLRDTVRSLWHALLRTACYLALALPLFVLHFVAPALAPAIWVAGLVQTALFLAFDAFDEPLHRRGYGFGGKWRFIGAHLPESLGFGLAAALLLLLPLIGLLIAPVSIVGGTLLYLDLSRARR